MKKSTISILLCLLFSYSDATSSGFDFGTNYNNNYLEFQPKSKPCRNCKKSYDKTKGYIEAAEVGCANTYSYFLALKKVSEAAVAKGVFPKSDYVKWLNAYTNYSWLYCSRKCVLESGSRICEQ